MIPRSSTASSSAGSFHQGSGHVPPSTSPPASSAFANLEHGRASDIDDAERDQGLSGSGSRAVSNTSSASAEIDTNIQQASIEVHPTFSQHAAHPGTVKIIVEATTFWAHKDVLHFASPFFEAALSGECVACSLDPVRSTDLGTHSWSESSSRDPSKRTSISSVITISQPPSFPGDTGAAAGTPRSSTFSASVTQRSVSSLGETASPTGSQSTPDSRETPSADAEKSDSSTPDTDTDLDLLSGSPGGADAESTESEDERRRLQQQRYKSLQRLGGTGKGQKFEKRKKRKTAPPPLRSSRTQQVEAVVVLKEERVSCCLRWGKPTQLTAAQATTFHDFLKFIYPHLDCTIAWNNVEGLYDRIASLTAVVPAALTALLQDEHCAETPRPIPAICLYELSTSPRGWETD